MFKGMFPEREDKNAKAKGLSFWNPRPSSDKIKKPEGLTFDNPRSYDNSDIAWSKKDFWYQKEPALELNYDKK